MRSGDLSKGYNFWLLCIIRLMFRRSVEKCRFEKQQKQESPKCWHIWKIVVKQVSLAVAVMNTSLRIMAMAGCWLRQLRNLIRKPAVYYKTYICTQAERAVLNEQLFLVVRNIDRRHRHAWQSWFHSFAPGICPVNCLICSVCFHCVGQLFLCKIRNTCAKGE